MYRVKLVSEFYKNLGFNVMGIKLIIDHYFTLRVYVLKLRVIDCIVTILFGVHLVLRLF